MEKSVVFLSEHLKNTFYSRLHMVDETTLLRRASLTVLIYYGNSEINQIGLSGMGLVFFSLLY